MYRKCIAICTVCLLLTACGKDAELADNISLDAQSVSQIEHTYSWDGITFEVVFPACTFEETTDALKIFPCYSMDSYITVRRIVISGNDFWNSVISQYKDTGNIRDMEDYSYVTTENGETLGYIKCAEHEAYLVETSTLPSGYVDNVLSVINSSIIHK